MTVRGQSSESWYYRYENNGISSVQCCLGRGLPPYQVASWSMQPFGPIDMGRKLGAAEPLFGEDGSSSNTTWPGTRPTSVSSGILIHPALWPQQTWAENWGRGYTPVFGGAGSPSNTRLLWPRPTSIPSGILIHPAVWPQQTWTENRGGLCPFGMSLIPI